MADENMKGAPSKSATGNVGCLVIFLLVGGAGISWWESLHDRPYYKDDVVVAQPADGAGGDSFKIQVAISEEALGELVDARGKTDWTAALVTGRAVFQVPGETKLAILDRNPLGWSVQHPRHVGVALKVRVLDGEHAGQIGYVLAAWLKFLDRPSRKQPGASAPEGKQAEDSTWRASCRDDHAFPSGPTGELSWSFPSRNTKAEAQEDADFHNALRGHHAEVEREFGWSEIKIVPEPEGKEAKSPTQDWIWTALCTKDHRKPPSANLAASHGRAVPAGIQKPRPKQMLTAIIG